MRTWIPETGRDLLDSLDGLCRSVTGRGFLDEPEEGCISSVDLDTETWASHVALRIPVEDIVDGRYLLTDMPYTACPTGSESGPTTFKPAYDRYPSLHRPSWGLVGGACYVMGTLACLEAAGIKRKYLKREYLDPTFRTVTATIPAAALAALVPCRNLAMAAYPAAGGFNVVVSGYMWAWLDCAWNYLKASGRQEAAAFISSALGSFKQQGDTNGR